MPDWSLWLIAAAALAAAETTSLALVLVMMAGGSVAGAVTAAFGAPVLIQFVVAVVATVALLGLVRPVAQRHLTPGGSTITGSDALVGMEAVVLQRVDGRDGRVRLNGGEWSARAYDDTQVLAPGATVRVVRISGATALVLGDEDEPVDKA